MKNLAPWRSPLASAIAQHCAQPHSNYFQLATVQTNGRPANRTVVFRGFLGNTDQIEMASDVRSDKIEQIRTHPWGEICWYFTQTREQFRIAGQLISIDAQTAKLGWQKERQRVWQTLSDRARQQFTWPAPKQPEQENSPSRSSPLPEKDSPHPNFCLLLLDPVQVDRLELRGTPHCRWLYRLDRSSQTWHTQQVNP